MIKRRWWIVFDDVQNDSGFRVKTDFEQRSAPVIDIAKRICWNSKSDVEFSVTVTTAICAGLALLIEWMRQATRKTKQTNPLLIKRMPAQMLAIGEGSRLERIFLYNKIIVVKHENAADIKAIWFCWKQAYWCDVEVFGLWRNGQHFDARVC